MADVKNTFEKNSYGDTLQPADRLKIEHHIYFQDDKTDISRLTVLPMERLQALRYESAEAEKAIFESLRGQADLWDNQAAVTLLIDKAIEYAKIPAAVHSSNQWGRDNANSDRQSISNMVYTMSYHFTEKTSYNKAAGKTVPVGYELTWDIYTNNPGGRRFAKIAGQSGKSFSDKADMEKYLNGRIKAYAHLFTEISPPIPPEYQKGFSVNGQLLPGYTVQGEKPKTIDRAAAIGGDSVVDRKLDELLKKEREDVNEPLNIRLANREMLESRADDGAWLKLPATAAQLTAALARIGAQGGEQGRDYFINAFDSPVAAVSRLPLDNIQKAGIDELNLLAAKLETLDDSEITKLNMIASFTPDWDSVHHLAEQAHNRDFYEHHPEITNHVLLGEHVINKSGLIQIPGKWAAAVDREKLGQIVAAEERGILDEQGYLVESGIDEGWQAITEIPQEYRITPKPEKQEREAMPQERQGDPNADYDTVAARAPAVAVAAAPIVLVSDNPRDRMKEITDKLEQGIKGIFNSEKYKTFLDTMSKFHNYSFNNCMLIAIQNPAATHVAGFNAWRDDFKRPVMKGEKGIKIFAPAPFTVKKEMEKIDPRTQKPVIGKDGKPVVEEVETKVPAFKIVSVFDVSQTDGEPLPALGVSELAGSVDKYRDFFAALEKASPAPIGFEAIGTGAKGYYSQTDKRIAINEGMSELQNLKTLIHEVAHARLHDIDKNAPPTVPRPDQQTREVQAESIAYAVCAHYGLDTSDYSFGYVASWSGGKEMDTLKASLDTIRKEAAAIITEVDKHFTELTRGREQTAMQGLEQETETTLQFFIDSDLKDHGELQPGTLEAIAVQGYEYRDGKLAQAAPALVSERGGTFTIYQLKDGDATRDLRFEPLDSLKQPPDLADYDNKYAAPLSDNISLKDIYYTFNMDRPEDFTGHSLSVSDIVVMNRDGKETAYYVDSAGFKELPGFLTPKEQAAEQSAPEKPAAAVDLKAVADYMQKQNEAIQAADPEKKQGQAAFNMALKRLEQANGKIPDEHPQLKVLITNAAQSPDLATLKERMDTLNTEFIQHYSTAVQMSIDTSGKAEPPTAAAPVQKAEPAPAQKPPAQGENVAEIEARVKAGEVINISDLSDAIKKDKQAAQTGKDAPQTPAKSGARNTAKKQDWKGAQKQDAWDRAQGKTTAKPAPEQPSIKEKIAAGRKEIAAQKPAPQRAQTKAAEIGG